VKNAECKMQSAKGKIQSAKCKGQNAKGKMQSAKCKFQKIKRTGSAQERKSRGEWRDKRFTSAAVT
jgi:hypothetical protein